MGLSGLPPEALWAWVEASCREQGVPVLVTDSEVLRQVAVLLGFGTRSGSGQAPAGA